jgi:acyl carrier protein
MSNNNIDKIIQIIISFFMERDKKIPSNDYDLFNGELIDSMDLIELIILLEKSLNIKIDQKYMTADNFRSVDQIVKTVIKQ